MRSFYKSVDVEIDDWDIKDYLDDLTDKELRELGLYRALDPNDFDKAPYKLLEELKKTLNELKTVVKFESYSHEAILLERLIRLSEHAKV